MTQLWYAVAALAVLAILYQMYYNQPMQSGGSQAQEEGVTGVEQPAKLRPGRWKANLFNNYYYYDPWWAYPSPYHRLCDAYARRNCGGSWYPRDCFREQYDKCVAESIY